MDEQMKRTTPYDVNLSELIMDEKLDSGYVFWFPAGFNWHFNLNEARTLSPAQPEHSGKHNGTHRQQWIAVKFPSFLLFLLLLADANVNKTEQISGKSW